MKPKLHSKRGYLYILLFLLSLASIHVVCHLISGSFPHILRFAQNPSATRMISQGALVNGQSSLGCILRYVFLRYGVYATLFFTFFADYCAHNPKHLHKILSPKILSAFSIILFLSIVLSGEFYYALVRFTWDIHTVFYFAIRFAGIKIRVYSLILWFSLYLSSFYLLQKKFQRHHALWFSALIFLSLDEVWEYAPFLYWNFAPSLTYFSSYLFRASPSFLLLFYSYKYVSVDILLISFFLASVFLSVGFITGFQIVRAYPLKVSWTATYIYLASKFENRGVAV